MPYHVLEVTAEPDTWQNEHGVFRTYRLRLEGQDKVAHLNQKAETAAPQVAGVLDLTLEPHPRFPDALKAKKAYSNSGGGRGGGKSIEERRSIALQASHKVAVDIVRMALDTGLWKPEQPSPALLGDAVMVTARKLYDQIEAVSA